ncbi:putative glycosyl [Erysiphe neolycopersici]|uniref:Putative glycosyl n=1 Tax=Erysiphe neolycopersici TaxID=212602 RepID=A0A420HTE1_9PEZI|nr:putative glycosyl [Erysiphe neolycopersici]
MEEYDDENWHGGELHGYFEAEFHKFTVRTFKKITDPAKHIRDFLRKRNSRGQTIPASLVDAVSYIWYRVP